jgi:ribosomal protein S18 acetylase RimI-like enzyme
VSGAQAAAGAQPLPFPVRLRPIEDRDHDFLAGLFAATRAAEFAAVPWDEASKRAFLRQQFQFQHHHYVRHYPGAQLSLIEHEGEPIGRIYISRTAGEIRLMEIALVEAWRNRGLGAALVATLLREAQDSGACVTLHVEPNNPAVRFYQRLGFARIEQRGVHDFMRWPADAGASHS